MSVYALDSNILSFYLRGNTIVAENMEKAIDIYVQERKAGRNTEDADIFIASFCIHMPMQ